jgi:hypothetical protein
MKPTKEALVRKLLVALANVDVDYVDDGFDKWGYREMKEVFDANEIKPIREQLNEIFNIEYKYNGKYE